MCMTVASFRPSSFAVRPVAVVLCRSVPLSSSSVLLCHLSVAIVPCPSAPSRPSVRPSSSSHFVVVIVVLNPHVSSSPSSSSAVRPLRASRTSSSSVRPSRRPSRCSPRRRRPLLLSRHVASVVMKSCRLAESLKSQLFLFCVRTIVPGQRLLAPMRTAVLRARICTRSVRTIPPELLSH